MWIRVLLTNLIPLVTVFEVILLKTFFSFTLTRFFYIKHDISLKFSISSLKRSSQRTLCSLEVIRAARERIAKGESQRRVAKSLGMAESTYFKKRLKRATVATCFGRYDTTLTKQMEEELCQYVKTLDNMFYGLTSRTLRCLAFEFAERNKIKHRFDVLAKNRKNIHWTCTWFDNFFESVVFALRTTRPLELLRDT